jgi:uncharacterized coiled-coil DUF342 family protein
MEVMTTVSWTDERLDDLNGKVESMHGEMQEEFKAVRGEMQEEFKAVRGEMQEEFKAVRGEMQEEFKAVRSEMREGFEAVQQSIERIQHSIYTLMITLIVVLGGIVAAAQF